MKYKQLPAGEKIGQREVLSFLGRDKYKVKCKCGNISIVVGYTLKKGLAKQCVECYKKIAGKSNIKHGHSSKTNSTYRIWVGMVRRCHNKNASDYHGYGLRGIKVCTEWRKNYEQFLSDMGERPIGKSLDRIDFQKGYYPGNCRWASGEEQCKNRSNNRRITARGKNMILKDWCKELGIKTSLFYQRIYRGLTEEEALFAPKKKWRGK